MKLSLEIIGDHLPQSFNPRLEGNPDDTLSLGRPRIYEPDSVLEPGKLYITRVQLLPKTLTVSGASFICDGGYLPLEWAVSDNQFLLLSNAPGSQRLLNMVQEIYDYFDVLDNAIADEFIKGRNFDIRNIVKYGSKMLGNPLSLSDLELKIILDTKVLYENDTRKYTTNYSQGLDDIEGYSLVKGACLLERELRKPYISNVQYNGCRIYCYNLYYADVFFGCAWLREEDKEFRKSDFKLADHIFEYLQQSIITYPDSINREASAKRNALRRLLEHSELSGESYEQFRLSPGELWKLFRLKELPDKKPLPKDYMLSALDILMKSSVCATIFNSNIIGLLKLQNDCDDGRDVATSLLKSILERMDYVGGISNSFGDIAQLNNAYLEAGFALERLLQKDDRQTIYFFQDCEFEYMLSRANGDLPLSELYSGELLRLYEYDKTHNVDYLKTLNVYLKTEMNATLSAKMLHIHRSSFLKRLEKITKLLDGYLEDPRKRMYYRLIFSIWEAGYGDDVANFAKCN